MRHPSKLIEINPHAPVRAKATVIGGPLDGRTFMIGISDGRAACESAKEAQTLREKYRVEFLAVDGVHFHIIIHKDLTFMTAILKLIEGYKPNA